MGGAERLPAGPLPGVLGLVGGLASRLYGLEIGRRNRRYDAGRGVIRFDRPVISVGNLSVGGTGKTPMVAHLLGVLLAAGRRPCVAMRGYAPGRGGGRASDEAAEYRRRFPEVPVVARPDRALGLISLFAGEYERDEARPTDCIVLDDGFQHRRIARDLDIVLIDATRDPFADRLLPAGWLREPVSSLRRAGAVAITHAESVTRERLASLERAVMEARGRGVEAVARHEWAGLVVSAGNGERGEREEPVSWLARRRVFCVCAIGNPGPFLAAAERAAGAPLAGRMVLRDHHPLGGATRRRLAAEVARSGANVVLCTEKDWSKLGGGAGEVAMGVPVARPRLTLVFERGGAALDGAVADIKEREPRAPARGRNGG